MNDTVLYPEIQVENYKIFRFDKNWHRGGVACWTPGRADRGPINSVLSVRPPATGISRERYIQFFRNLA